MPRKPLQRVKAKRSFEGVRENFSPKEKFLRQLLTNEDVFIIIMLYSCTI